MIHFARKTQKFSLSKKLYAAPVLCFLFLLLISCSKDSVQKTVVPDQGWSQTHLQDQVSLNLLTSKKEITIAGQLELTLEASAPENMEVAFPVYSAGLGDFTLKDTHTLPARMAGSGNNPRVLHRVTYILAPYLSGVYTIPAMTVTFHDTKNNVPVLELMTEQINIPVKSLLDPGTEQIAIRDITPPYSLPPNKVKLFLLASLAILTAGLALSLFYYWKKRGHTKETPEIQPWPEEIARQELERLLAENLLARGEIKLFHLRISDILRRYIENRFAVRAPEQTTEEFLLELSRAGSASRTLLGNHGTLLADFLTQCDLVKFAKHKPSLAECDKTIAICREFIENTKEDRFQGVEVSRVQGNKFKD